MAHDPPPREWGNLKPALDRSCDTIQGAAPLRLRMVVCHFALSVRLAALHMMSTLTVNDPSGSVSILNEIGFPGMNNAAQRLNSAETAWNTASLASRARPAPRTSPARMFPAAT